MSTYLTRTMHAHNITFSKILVLGVYTEKTTVAPSKTCTLKPDFKNMRFQSPKCSCRVNEQAKHIKSFLFLASLNMRTGELSVNTRQLRYLKKWLRYLLLNKKVTRCFTSYKGKVIWLRRSRYLCCFTPTLATFTQQQNTVQSCI